MNQFLNILQKYGVLVIILLLLVITFKSCSTSTTVTKLERRIEVLDSTQKMNSNLSKSDVDSIVTQRLYDFLIFEDDLDNGKLSLSDIRLKITKNEK